MSIEIAKTTFLDVALDYAKAGFNVFPLQAMDKIPLPGSKGVHEATTDKRQIETWWTRHRNSNIGIHCTHFWALDVDPKHNGPSALDGLLREYGPLPETLTQTSGSGGKHYLFTSPIGIFIKNRAGFYPGLDTRAFGGYIVAAPSIHPDGTEYTWDNWGTEIAPAPEWLINMVKDKREAFKSPERSDTGSRDIDDAKFAGYLFNGGMTEDEVFAALQARNNDPNRRDVPLPTNEIWKTVRSIGSRDIRTPAALRQALQETATLAKAGRNEIKPNPMWEEDLVRSKTLLPKNCERNAFLALANAPIFCNSLAFDEFSCEVKLIRNVVDPTSGNVLGRLKTGTVVDEHIAKELLITAQQFITSVTFSEQMMGSGISTVARLNGFHPVQDYLNSLVWDGKPRIDSWLIDHIGADDDDDGYTRAVGRRWLIAAVSRALKPGCKADCALIIEGTQGCRKSSALRTLAGADWFKDSTIDFKSKDRFSAVKGVWIYEMAEFDQYRNHDAATIKNFLSSQDDSYRPAYARTDAKYPRGVVFVGTTNKDKYLTDDTGDRRFWPVRSNRTLLNPIDTDKLAAERDQIWAEAVRAYYNGEPAFIDVPAVIAAHARITRERHDVEDTWADEFIRPYLAAHISKRITTGDLMNHALQLKTTEHTRANQQRVKNIMHNLGYTYKNTWVDNVQSKSWARKDGQLSLR